MTENDCKFLHFMENTGISFINTAKHFRDNKKLDAYDIYILQCNLDSVKITKKLLKNYILERKFLKWKWLKVKLKK